MNAIQCNTKQYNAIQYNTKTLKRGAVCEETFCAAQAAERYARAAVWRAAAVAFDGAAGNPQQQDYALFRRLLVRHVF